MTIRQAFPRPIAPRGFTDFLTFDAFPDVTNFLFTKALTFSNSTRNAPV